VPTSTLPAAVKALNIDNNHLAIVGHSPLAVYVGAKPVLIYKINGPSNTIPQQVQECLKLSNMSAVIVSYRNCESVVFSKHCVFRELATERWNK